MPSAEVLNSHPLSVLRKEVAESNRKLGAIPAYEKSMTKPKLVALMLKHKSRFHHIKMATKVPRKKAVLKPETIKAREAAAKARESARAEKSKAREAVKAEKAKAREAVKAEKLKTREAAAKARAEVKAFKEKAKAMKVKLPKAPKAPKAPGAKRKPSPWLAHLAAFRKANPNVKGVGNVAREARKTYKK